MSDTDKYTASRILVGEVSSEKSAATFDKKQKFTEYKKVTSIQKIVFISQIQKLVMVYRRGRSVFDWSVSEYSEGDVIFESINFKLAIDDIYKRMTIG